MGSGIPMDLSEVAFKCNFAHMNEATNMVEKYILTSFDHLNLCQRRRVDREFPEWGLPLIEALNGFRVPGYDEHYITVLHATEHRCGVKLSGPGLTDQITGTDPLKDNLPLRKVIAKDKNDEKGVHTATVVGFSQEK